jgi:hypothetical protein
MPLRILELGKQFRPATSITYPPFKNGKYLEEYFYDYALLHKDEIESDRVYIPIFWTNLQNHPGFTNQRANYEFLLSRALAKMPTTTKYFTVVQHDDGPQLKVSGDVLIFGACSGQIPLPLIYQDENNTLLNTPRPENKTLLASFIGSNTHPLRMKIKDAFINKADVFLGIQGLWTPVVTENQAELFIHKTLESKFCLAPRGYGRSSFRFFEAMLLGTIPVYFWDDREWLPYEDILDYSKFSVSIYEKDISKAYDILKSISEEKYASMLEELDKVVKYFTLDYMCEYIINQIK